MNQCQEEGCRSSENTCIEAKITLSSTSVEVPVNQDSHVDVDNQVTHALAAYQSALQLAQFGELTGLAKQYTVCLKTIY